MRKTPKNMIFTLAAALMAVVSAYGQGSTYSIGLKFAVDDGSSGNYSVTNLPPSAVAGLPSVAQANWNLLAGGTSNSASQLSAIVDKTGAATPVQVSWNSANLWRSLAGNMANFLTDPSPDRALLVTYLDIGNTGTNLVTITGIPTALTTSKYDVYVYMGSDTGGRGGRYTLIDGSTGAPLGTNLFVTATSSTNYVQDPGTTQTAMTGNYIVFRGISSSSVILQATTSRNGVSSQPRTPISAVQLVAETSAGEPQPATGLALSTSAGSGKVSISWTTNAGTVGSLVLMRTNRVVTAQPVDGTVYAANSVFSLGQNLGDDNINSGNYAVYSGPATNVIVSGLTPLLATNFISVFTYSTTGGNPNYTLAAPASGVPASGSVVATGTVLSITNRLPTIMYTNGAIGSAVFATFDVGAPVDVTAGATYVSSATNVLTVSGAGLVTGVGIATNLSAVITTTYVIGTTTNRATNTITVISPPAPTLTHRYSFTADATDSVGGVNGILQGTANVTGGQLAIDGNVGSYCDLTPALSVDLTNYDAITYELWVTDNGTQNNGRFFDFGNLSGANGINYMSFEPSSSTSLRAAYTLNNAAVGEQQINPGVRPGIGAKTHIVITTDFNTRRGVMYYNGVQVGVNTAMSWSPKLVGYTTNNWIGRSQWSADPWLIGSEDEFRIWRNAMQPFQVAINYTAGPNTIPPADVGAPTAIHLTIPFATAGLGARQIVSVTADYASVSGVNITTVGQAVYTSSNTNVATIDGTGNIKALSAGTTTITATLGARSDSKPLTVVVKPIVLAHRYSFSEPSGTFTFADSVGGSAFTAAFEPGFGGGANGGTVTLDGVASYVQMPSGLITGSENVTVEAWATVDPATVPSGNVRIWTIGSINNGNELMLSGPSARVNAQSFSRFQGSTTATANLAGDLSSIGPAHFVSVFDPNNARVDFYINGRWINSNTNLQMTMDQIIDARGLLGASHGLGSFAAVTFDEFRVWQGAFQLPAVRASYAAGPNNVVNPILAGTAPSAVSLRVDPVLPVGSRTLPKISVTYSGVASPVDLSGLQGVVTYSSSDPTVIAVNSNFLQQRLAFTNTMFEAVAPGTATVTVSVGGVTSSAQTITVVPNTTTMLTHEWRFNEAVANPAAGKVVADSVGVQDGLVWGLGSSLTGTQISFNPNNNATINTTNDKNCYVELPSGLISSYDAATIEAWFSSGGNIQANNRLFDFGTYNAGYQGSGMSYVFLTTDDGAVGGPNRTAMLLPPGTAETTINWRPAMTNGTFHVTVVMDQPHNFFGAYTNGVLAASTTNNKLLRSLADIKNYIGHSMWNNDTTLIGSVDEFRVYAGALSAAQVANSHALGPNAVPVLAPALSMTQSGTNLIFQWKTTPGFNLKSSPNLTPNSGYTSVGGGQGGGALTTKTIPAPTQTTFYILGNP